MTATVIRPIRQTDAARYLELCTRLDGETRYMMLEPGERDQSLKRQRGLIRDYMDRPNHIILVADTGRELAGYVLARGGRYRRDQHKAHVVVGVLRRFSGQGLGTRLFHQLDLWARDRIHRLELTVMAHNRKAIRLYQKMGFQTEGRLTHSLKVAGDWVDEYLMAKLTGTLPAMGKTS